MNAISKHNGTVKPRVNWSYIAGFIDGEGSITKHGETDYRITVSQTNEEVLKMIQVFTKSGNICQVTKRKEHWKESWVYVVARQKDVLVFLKKIYPYSIVKKNLIRNLIPVITKVVLKQRERKANLQKNIKRSKLLRKKGLSYRAIGKKLGIDHGYVRRLILFKGRNP